MWNRLCVLSFILVASGVILSLRVNAAPVSSPAGKAFHQGISLGLFAEDPGFSYQPLLEEMAATGASHVGIVIPYYLHNVRSVAIYRHPRFSPSDETVERTLKQATELGLKVFLFPILRLEYVTTPPQWRGTSLPQEWRGNLAPRDAAIWWRNYTKHMVKWARVARRHRVELLCVGSELASLDTDPAPWKRVIGAIRQHYTGALIYSANWDHYPRVRIWHLVDVAGISAYFQLVQPQQRALTRQRLIHAWRRLRVNISRWRAQINKPLMFTEIGYHSQRGTSADPADESAEKPIDLREQELCYQAFARVWRDVPYLHGVYFWNWFGYGGPHSREYTPRGKPATRVLCRWFGAARNQCPSRWGMPWRAKPTNH